MSKITHEIKPGDRVIVKKKVVEGDKERIQAIEGIVIARKHGNEPQATITVRKIASGVGVEFVFPINSPLVDSIDVVKRHKTRRAKLYYLRERAGKSARLIEKEDPSLKEAPKEKKPKEEKKKKVEEEKEIKSDDKTKKKEVKAEEKKEDKKEEKKEAVKK